MKVPALPPLGPPFPFGSKGWIGEMLGWGDPKTTARDREIERRRRIRDDLEKRRLCRYYLTLIEMGDPYGQIGYDVCMGRKGTQAHPLKLTDFDDSLVSDIASMFGIEQINWGGEHPEWDKCVRRCLIKFDQATREGSGSWGMSASRRIAHDFCYLYCHKKYGSALPTLAVAFLDGAKAAFGNVRWAIWKASADDWGL